MVWLVCSPCCRRLHHVPPHTLLIWFFFILSLAHFLQLGSASVPPWVCLVRVLCAVESEACRAAGFQYTIVVRSPSVRSSLETGSNCDRLSPCGATGSSELGCMPYESSITERQEIPTFGFNLRSKRINLLSRLHTGVVSPECSPLTGAAWCLRHRASAFKRCQTTPAWRRRHDTAVARRSTLPPHGTHITTSAGFEPSTWKQPCLMADKTKQSLPTKPHTLAHQHGFRTAKVMEGYSPSSYIWGFRNLHKMTIYYVPSTGHQLTQAPSVGRPDMNSLNGGATLMPNRSDRRHRSGGLQEPPCPAPANPPHLPPAC